MRRVVCLTCTSRRTRTRKQALCVSLQVCQTALERHLKTYQVGGSRYPCSHCKRHRGENSFRRKEHLTQHLQGYHHMNIKIEDAGSKQHLICPHTDCVWHRGLAAGHLGHLVIEKTGPFGVSASTLSICGNFTVNLLTHVLSRTVQRVAEKDTSESWT